MPEPGAPSDESHRPRRATPPLYGMTAAMRYTRTMTARRVLITVPHTYQRDAPYLERLEAAGLEAERRIGRHGKLTEDELRDALPGVFATLASSEPYTERVFRGAPELRVVARWGVGFDAIDVDAATRHGVVVCTAVGPTTRRWPTTRYR